MRIEHENEFSTLFLHLRLGIERKLCQSRTSTSPQSRRTWVHLSRDRPCHLHWSHRQLLSNPARWQDSFWNVSHPIWNPLQSVHFIWNHFFRSSMVNQWLASFKRRSLKMTHKISSDLVSCDIVEVVEHWVVDDNLASKSVASWHSHCDI